MEAYLCLPGKSFQARQIVRQTGLSRQVVNRHLKRMVLNQELVMTGARRGVRYTAGPGFAWLRQGANRGASDRAVWSRLAEQCQGFGYVRLDRLGHRMHTRTQARAALDGLYEKVFLVVDFQGVQSVSDAFADEMFVLHASMYTYPPEPINASARVETVIARVRRLYELRIYKDEGGE